MSKFPTQLALSYVQGNYINQEMESLFLSQSMLFERILHHGVCIGWRFVVLNREVELYVCRENFISFAEGQERFEPPIAPYADYYELFSRNHAAKSLLVLQSSTHSLPTPALRAVLERIVAHTGGMMPPPENNGWFTDGRPHKNNSIDEQNRQTNLFDGLWKELLR